MAETSFEALPEDSLVENLLTSSLKSLKRSVLVSEKCASIIGHKNFRDAYLLRSITKPKMLLIDYKIGRGALFYSVYQEEEPLLWSGQPTMRIDSKEVVYMISKPIRGLISIQHNTEVMICNPGLETFRSLTEIKAPKVADIKTYFGYDEVNDVFKVLCVARSPTESNGSSEGAEEYQVLTVGSSLEERWRPITCQHDHTPVTEGLCKGGVLYYGARFDSFKPVVMSFNLSSEKFNVIELPEEVDFHFRYNLVNYNGEIALMNDFDFDSGIVNETDGKFKIWVRNEIEGEGKWCKNHNLIVIPHWKETVGNKRFCFKGTIGTGELVFAPHIHDVTLDGLFSVLYYDTVTENLRRVQIEGIAGGPGHNIHTFFDHVDSPHLICEEQELLVH